MNENNLVIYYFSQDFFFEKFKFHGKKLLIEKKWFIFN